MNILFAFAHSNDSATADLESKSLKHFDILNALLKSMGRTDVTVVSPAAVQVVVDPVESGFF